MPKKTDKEMNVVNWYEKIPKRLLLKADNPNYEHHKLHIPARFLLIGGSGSGKTSYLLTLLMKAFNNTFANIWIITRNKDEPLYAYLASMDDRIHILEGLENTPKLDDMDKEVNNCVVFDDMVTTKDQRIMENFFIRARKLNCSVFMLSQSFFRISKLIRQQASYVIVLKLSGTKDLRIILSDLSLGIGKQTLENMYVYATNEKFSPLLLDMEASPEHRFRRGFLEYLDPSDYGEK
jgi:hypothetical protein